MSTKRELELERRVSEGRRTECLRLADALRLEWIRAENALEALEALREENADLRRAVEIAENHLNDLIWKNED